MISLTAFVRDRVTQFLREPAFMGLSILNSTVRRTADLVLASGGVHILLFMEAPAEHDRNRWVRDACMREDKTRSKNYNLNCNLSALRACLVALKANLHPDPSWPEFQERCQHNPQIPFHALLKHRSK